MFVLSLIALAIASISAFVSLNAKEEVFKVAMACLAIVSVFLTLILAPWEIQLIVVAIPLAIAQGAAPKAIAKFNHRSTEKSMN
ncbi:MAG: riboflavin synthase subunit alpha [Hydrococcus sp. Prado102]|jgi:hypothetical protein|nr:riboflavin synthase subunit alpha [Hydrococcus sp. Prado102]